MNSKITSIIVGTGSCIPTKTVSNQHFLHHSFYEKNGEKIDRDIAEIITKFQDITEIEERRYAEEGQVASDLGFEAAQQAIYSSGIDAETLDYIIVAHNYGDITNGSNYVNTVPTLAARIKHKLRIKNPDCVAYDLPFGCPGWLQGMIQADYYIRSGEAKRILVIGAETLSRVTDPHDRDSMIFADGAGATLLEGVETSNSMGILSHKTQSHTFEEAFYLNSAQSSNPDYLKPDSFIKMDGRKIYEYALTNVPLVMKQAIDKAGITLSGVNKILVHQANGKMDTAIAKRLFKLYGIAEVPHNMMPMTISKFGNSSVATIPTLLDLILKGQLPGHQINVGDAVVFASVGAGMNINAMVCRF